MRLSRGRYVPYTDQNRYSLPFLFPVRSVLSTRNREGANGVSESSAHPPLPSLQESGDSFISYHNTATNGRYHFVVSEIDAVLTNQCLAVYCAVRVDAHGFIVECLSHMPVLIVFEPTLVSR